MVLVPFVTLSLVFEVISLRCDHARNG